MTTRITPRPSPPPQNKPAALGPFHDRREMLLAALLAALAGATGAAAWLYSSGWFVTFMTGNSERMVLENVKDRHAIALAAAATVAAFVAGVIVATLARLYVWKKARHGATVLTMFACIAAWLCDIIFVHEGRAIGAIPVLWLAFGLGALNTSISRKGEVVMPLSYMTGTLVKTGQGIALHLAGRRRWAWVAHVSTYTGFLSGAALGGLLFALINTADTLLVLAVIATVIAAVTWRLDHPRFLDQDIH